MFCLIEIDANPALTNRQRPRGMAAAHRARSNRDHDVLPPKDRLRRDARNGVLSCSPCVFDGPHDYSIHDDGQRIGIRFATSARPAHIPGKNCDA
jgi:hypothetical protein